MSASLGSDSSLGLGTRNPAVSTFRLKSSLTLHVWFYSCAYEAVLFSTDVLATGAAEGKALKEVTLFTFGCYADPTLDPALSVFFILLLRVLITLKGTHRWANRGTERMRSLLHESSPVWFQSSCSHSLNLMPLKRAERENVWLYRKDATDLSLVCRGTAQEVEWSVHLEACVRSPLCT